MQNNPPGRGEVEVGNQVPMPLASSLTARYLIDSGISRFTVRAFATGLLSAIGHNPTIAINDFKGQVRVGSDSLEGASLRMAIKADSLTVQNQISDKDRREMEKKMMKEVLETDRFPEIVYECTDVSGSYGVAGPSLVVLNGNLTLHGITRNLSINTTASLLGNLLRASGEFSIQQSDYGIRPVSAVGGTIRLKDELKFSFEVVARKQNNQSL